MGSELKLQIIIGVVVLLLILPVVLRFFWKKSNLRKLARQEQLKAQKKAPKSKSRHSLDQTYEVYSIKSEELKNK